jgi:hypothetical protein
MLELLVALTLFALMIAAVPALVRMAGRSVQIAGELTRSHADVAALDAIADKLSEARPLTIQQDDGSRRIQFWGTEDSIRFVAPGLVGDTGGLLTYELGLIQNRAGQPVLALARYPFTVDQSDGQPSGGDVRLPMPATRKLAFRYFGPQGDDATSVWSNRWEQTKSLPQLVEIGTLSVWNRAPRTRTVMVPLRYYEVPRRFP